ncbi:MAG TPA: alpha-amylase family glycosyl hydrolase [Ignavibacteriaceae bacterium]|nr:alpha-amylase family glycosyl hydrolase [Ignavibacteriaceae bacterium]
MFIRKIINISLLFLFILFVTSNLFAQEITTVKHPDWAKNATIYEVNIRQYTPEGTFKAFQKHLHQLKDMGVDILWLMPINPIGKLNRKGSLGSYYSISDYNKVNPEFGTLNDFKSLVNEAHKLGLKVIVDWVANHTSWDNVWTKTHPEYYKTDNSGNFVSPVKDWTDVIGLNFNNPKLWIAMENSMEYWIKECDIDGYRCDVAGMVQMPFWNFVRKELDKIKPVFMLAEAEGTQFHKHAFDMTYAWEFHNITKEIYAGKQTVKDLDNYFNKDDNNYNSDAYRMDFTSNHDENSWKESVFERYGDAVKTFAVLCGVVKGMPLVYSGQEAGMDKSLRFFDKDTIEWKKSDLREIYTKLNHLKMRNKALWNGNAGGKMNRLQTSDDTNVFAFEREKDGNKIIAIFNLSKNEEDININSEKLAGNYSNLFSKKNVRLKNEDSFKLKPWGYLVLYK